MQLNIFFQVLSLALLKARVPSNRIASLLREPISYEKADVLDFKSVNPLLSHHSSTLPNLSAADWDAAKRMHEQNTSGDFSVLAINDEKYPKYLKVIKDAPPVLFIRGNENIFTDLPGVAIVGARDATEKGAEIARRIARFMAENNWPVVSGLALGIDAAAHRGSLDGNGKTIAVLAGGLEKPSPASNTELGYEILEKGGAWISEHPVGVPPRKENFVPRNRIQIGLSAGSIIVEARIKSGSLSQARFCVGQNRPLFAVIPHHSSNPLNLNCEGTVHMVHELGAIPIKTKSEYAKVLAMLSNEKKIII